MDNIMTPPSTLEKVKYSSMDLQCETVKAICQDPLLREVYIEDHVKVDKVPSQTILVGN